MKSLKLVIASQNKGKIQEFKQLFAPLGIQVTSLLDYPEIPEVDETGDTFEANARLKAETIAHTLNCLVLSDDSGLVVPALNGEPGVYSARYAGEPKDDQRNIEKLLTQLHDVQAPNRMAYFVCCLVVAHPKKASLVIEGRAYGEIAHEVHGAGGFGYDPVFYVPDEGQTFAQLGSERKNQISHRANALKSLMLELPKWLEEIDAP